MHLTEQLANTERHMDLGKVHALRAEDRTDELKKLNRSIFRPAITFNKDHKRAEQQAKVQARFDEQQHEREKAMSDVRATQNRIGRANASNPAGEDGEEGLSGRRIHNSEAQASRKEHRKRYQFEATASDDELEDEIDDNLDSIGNAVKNIKQLALAAGEELDTQNSRLDNIASKTSKLNYSVDTTTTKVSLKYAIWYIALLNPLRAKASPHQIASFFREGQVWTVWFGSLCTYIIPKGTYIPVSRRMT